MYWMFPLLGILLTLCLAGLGILMVLAMGWAGWRRNGDKAKTDAGSSGHVPSVSPRADT